jgi:hypothetical protein
MSQPKIFCIGFHKTGTTSLGAALTHLGYRVTGPNWIDNPRIAEEALPLALDLVPKYDAFRDNPWPVLYEDLHREFPTAKFILTVRAADAWIDSVLRHFADASTPMREWIYGHGHGSPRGNESIYVARMEQHNRDVEAHFGNKAGSLLVLRVTDGEGWNRLCPFLEKPMPDCAFPQLNAAEQRVAAAATSRCI